MLQKCLAVVRSRDSLCIGLVVKKAYDRNYGLGIIVVKLDLLGAAFLVNGLILPRAWLLSISIRHSP